MTLLRTTAVAAVASAVAYRAVRSTAGGALSRTNFRDEPVTLAEGPAVVAGLAAGSYDVPVAAVTAVVAGGLGLLDDLAGSADSRGLGGHLRALVTGDVTTGAVKVVGLGLLAVAATVATDSSRPGALRTPLGAVVVAGSANLMNLFDLRPGRALKVATVAALPLLPAQPRIAGGVLGTVVALAADDLAGRSMMGDTGANPLGAVLGVAVVRSTGPRGRLVAATVVTALNLASEKVSFSAFIASRPVLRALDEWGRRP